MQDPQTDTLEKILSKNYVKGVKRSIDIPSISVYEILKNTASESPDNAAFSFYGRRFTYREFLSRVDNAADYLSNNGVKQDDRVNLMLPNVPHFPVMFYALMKLGAIVVQTNPMYSTNEIKNEAIDSGSRILISMADFAPKAVSLIPDFLDKVIVVRVSEFLPSSLAVFYNLGEGRKIKALRNASNGVSVYSSLKENGKKAEAAKFDPSEQSAVFQYTGGTTGTPKAAILTHTNLVANIYQITEWLPEKFKKNLVHLCAIPFFHVYGMMTAMLLPVFQGSEMLLLPDPRNTSQILKTIQKRKPQVFPGIPAMYHSVVNYPQVAKYDLGSIEFCISGAAPLPLEVQEVFEKATGAAILEGYGLSEASPVTNVNPIEPDDLVGRRKPGSIGFALPNTFERIVDRETGETDVPFGEVGELIIKGPQVMKGYWNNKEETESTLRNGWLYTGDLARVDEEGYTYIVDRKKDMIIASGYNIYPREVEEVLYRCPKVSEAAVVGVMDPHRGETVKAFIVPQKGQTPTEQEIKDFCTEYLAKYKIPRLYEFVNELPKSLVGKVLRRELREKEEAGKPKE